MATYFTADLHLGHNAILEYEQRPWASIEEHDAAMIEQINATVARDDRLFILGDFTMCLRPHVVQAYLDAIECKNRWLIVGNHDKADALFEPGAFVRCCHYEEILVDGVLCCLSHYPMLDWNMGKGHHGVPTNEASIMLHGHIHSHAQDLNDANARAGVWRYDVGVDANGYKPVSLEAILDFIAARDPDCAQLDTAPIRMSRRL